MIGVLQVGSNPGFHPNSLLSLGKFSPKLSDKV